MAKSNLTTNLCKLIPTHYKPHQVRVTTAGERVEDGAVASFLSLVRCCL